MDWTQQGQQMLLLLALLRPVLGHVTRFMIQLLKTKSYQRLSNPAGWVTVWADFIVIGHILTTESEF